MTADMDPIQCCIELNMFIQLFRIREPKANPQSDKQEDNSESFKRAIFADFQDNAVGKAFVKATQYFEGLLKHIQLTPEQRL